MSDGTRRRRVIAFSVSVVAAATVVAAAIGIGGSGGDGTALAGERPAATATITRQTLVDATTVAGELGYGAETPVESKAAGTVTWLPPVGRTIRRGGVLLRADDKPVVLLYGSLPMYRTLGPAEEAATAAPTDTVPVGRESGEAASAATEQAASAAPESAAPAATESAAPAATESAAPAAVATPATSGRDVEQFERNLRALGYGGFTVDREYTDRTARAVKRWQKDLGLPRSGSVQSGDIVYVKGPVRIASHGVRVGAAATGEVLTSTSTSKVVTVNARTTDADWAVRGNKVRVVLPGGRSVLGSVAAVGTEAARGQSEGEGGDGEDGEPDTGTDNATVPVTVAVVDQKALHKWDQAPVDVRYTAQTRKNVLTVPVAALLALAEGGYGLEVVGGTGTRIVAVRAGLFADGQVEVTGEAIHVGQKVGMPG